MIKTNPDQSFVNTTGFGRTYTVKSDYLQNEEYSHHFETSMYLEIYAYTERDSFDTNDIYLVATVKGNVTSGSMSRDRSSEYCASCSLEMVISPDCMFEPERNFNWGNKIVKIIKTYNFLNDKNRSYYNNNAVEPYFTDREPDELKMSLGYYVVDESTVTYNAETRTLSLSGSDVISVFGSEHGGTLIDYRNYKADINGMVIPAIDDSGNPNDIEFVINTLIDTYSPIELTIGGTHGTYVDIDELWDGFIDGSGLSPSEGTYANGKLIPYDLEFNTEVYLFDVLKTIKDLYEGRIMYMGVDELRYFIRRMPQCYMEFLYPNVHFGRDIANLVMSETTTTNYHGIYNCYDVYGKPQTVTTTETMEIEDSSVSADNPIKTTVTQTGTENNSTSVSTTLAYNKTTKKVTKTVNTSTTTIPHAFYYFNMFNSTYHHPFNAINLNTRKMTIQDDTCATDADCFYKGKYECIKNLEFREKTTITLCDNYLIGYYANGGLENLCVGTFMEYTSVQTGETNLYIVDKVSHDFSNATWTLDIEPFFPTRTTPNIYNYSFDGLYYDGGWKLSKPEVTYTIGENGKVTFEVNNGGHTQWSMFKFYIQESNVASMSNLHFIGETCTTKTENITSNKVFEYQFPADGTYHLYVSAYSTLYEPSELTYVPIEITNMSTYLTDEKDNKLTDEKNNKLYK